MITYISLLVLTCFLVWLWVKVYFTGLYLWKFYIDIQKWSGLDALIALLFTGIAYVAFYIYFSYLDRVGINWIATLYTAFFTIIPSGVGYISIKYYRSRMK